MHGWGLSKGQRSPVVVLGDGRGGGGQGPHSPVCLCVFRTGVGTRALAFLCVGSGGGVSGPMLTCVMFEQGGGVLRYGSGAMLTCVCMCLRMGPGQAHLIL